MGVENDTFLSELWLAFGQLGETPPPKILRSTPGWEGGVEFLLADFNQLRAIQSCGSFLSLGLAKPWANGKQNSRLLHQIIMQCHLMKNSCESLKLVSKKD